MPDTVTIKAFKKNNVSDLYVLNYAALTNSVLYFDIINPYGNVGDDPIMYGYEVVRNEIAIGNNTFITTTNTLTASISEAGVYPLQLTTVFRNGTTSSYSHYDPIRIYNEWPAYNYSTTRILSNSTPILPYTLEEVTIKPNEFGVADVINASLLKLSKCLQSIKNYCTIIYNKIPTSYIGWLGVHSSFISKGVKWYTSSNIPDYSRDSDRALTEAQNFNFKNISDIKVVGSELYIASKTADNSPCIIFGINVGAFTHFVVNRELPFLSQIKNITSFAIIATSTYTRTLYIVDNLTNKIYKVLLNLNTSNKTITSIYDYDISGYLETSMGGFGGKDATSRFYSPGDIKIAENFLYIVDTNNYCIKKFSLSLGWIKTYYIPDFETHHPVSVAVTAAKHNSSMQMPSVVSILTDTGRVYMFNQDGTIFDTDIPYTIEISANSVPVKLITDKTEDFFYIICKAEVLKYSIGGLYINKVEYLPDTTEYNSGCVDNNCNVYVSCQNKIFKFLDIIQDFSIYNKEHEALLWSDEEIKINEEEFVQDWSINRAFFRVAANVDILRKSIHSRFGITTVNVGTDSLTYYTAIPISSTETEPCKHLLEQLGVGANEFTLSQILNRNIEKIYNCIDSIRVFTDASYLTRAEGGTACSDAFCWSWKNTKCSDISLPVLRICNINPITFAELQQESPRTYAPTVTWREAVGDCCNQ